MDCPACGAPHASSGSYIVFCESCGHRWLGRTRQDHGAIATATYTQEYAGYRPDQHYVRAATRLIQAELLTRVAPPAHLLDVGCGAGDFMTVAQTLGYDAEGIDISEASEKICRSKGLRACAADFLTHDFQREFDLIVMWDVVAHLHDPAAFFSRARSLLTARGVLIVKTPAFGDLSVRLSNRWPRVAGTLLGAPSHSQYFDRESLSTLFSRTGFDSEWIVPPRVRSRGEGGSFRRRVARRLRSGMGRLSGDASVLVAASPRGRSPSA